jgi:Carbohydrate-selective porin, OprB family/S-layer homology domain
MGGRDTTGVSFAGALACTRGNHHGSTCLLQRLQVCNRLATHEHADSLRPTGRLAARTIIALQRSSLFLAVVPSMKHLRRLLTAPAALGLLPPLACQAGELDLATVNRYAAAEQVTSLSQLSDVKPTDWAYQALSNLIERYGCVAGYPNGTYRGARAMTRFEAAALLNACLDRVSEVTDELKKLMAEFDKELAVLKGRVDGLEAKVGLLEAQQFSTTTKLKVDANMVVGGNSFLGSASNLVSDARNNYGAVTFNYDLRIDLLTSFTGNDLLRTRLRAGNFDTNSNSFYGGLHPTRLSQLEAAYQEDAGPNLVGIDRLYYQFPVGNFTLTFGALVEQNDMLAMYPSVYPDSTILDMFTMAGTPVTYDLNVGAGAGIWWKQDAWSVSLQYTSQGANSGNPGEGGIGTQSSLASTTVQLGYQKEQWALALAYSAIQGEVSPYSTNFMQQWFDQPGLTNTIGLSGYWQPVNSGWVPSISAGWEISQLTYNQPLGVDGDPARNAVAWSVGLQWLDVLAPGNSAGMAFGQAPFATSLVSGAGVNDANWMWEWWYKIQVSDAIAVTPGLFYLSRPMGQDTPAGQSFNQLGALVKTQFRF